VSQVLCSGVLVAIGDLQESSKHFVFIARGSQLSLKSPHSMENHFQNQTSTDSSLKQHTKGHMNYTWSHIQS
jgi:hypothetical protein